MTMQNTVSCPECGRSDLIAEHSTDGGINVEIYECHWCSKKWRADGRDIIVATPPEQLHAELQRSWMLEDAGEKLRDQPVSDALMRAAADAAGVELTPVDELRHGVTHWRRSDTRLICRVATRQDAQDLKSVLWAAGCGCGGYPGIDRFNRHSDNLGAELPSGARAVLPGSVEAVVYDLETKHPALRETSR